MEVARHKTKPARVANALGSTQLIQLEKCAFTLTPATKPFELSDLHRMIGVAGNEVIHVLPPLWQGFGFRVIAVTEKQEARLI